MDPIDPFGKELNSLIVDTYQTIGRLEDAMVHDMSNGNITISELHMIECIGTHRNTGATVTEIAQEMDITLPSVTTAVKKLEKKGLVTKQRSESDARQVVVRLTDAGLRADIAHRYFHRKMVLAVASSIPEEEKSVLLVALRKINSFFQERIEEMEAKSSQKGEENG